MSSGPLFILDGSPLASLLEELALSTPGFCPWTGPGQDPGSSTPVASGNHLALSAASLAEASPGSRFLAVEHSPFLHARTVVGRGADAVRDALAPLTAEPALEEAIRSRFRAIAHGEPSEHPFARLGLLCIHRTALVRAVLQSLAADRFLRIDASAWITEPEAVTRRVFEFVGLGEPTAGSVQSIVACLNTLARPRAVLETPVRKWIKEVQVIYGLGDLLRPDRGTEGWSESASPNYAPEPLSPLQCERLLVVDDPELDGTHGAVQADRIFEPSTGEFGLLPIEDGQLQQLVCSFDLAAARQPERIAFLRDARRALAPRGEVTISIRGEDELQQVEADAFRAGLRPTRESKEAPGDPAVVGGRESDDRRTLTCSVPDRSSDDPQPLVSVLIPAFNPRFMEDTLRSAIEQSWTNLEILVGDDCAGDGVEEIVRNFQEHDPRITYHRNPSPPGAVANFVNLLGRASGDYIKYLNDDDLLAPECVSRMMEALLGNPRAVLVSSRRKRIDEQGQDLPDDDGNAPLTDFDFYAEGVSLMDAMLDEERNALGEPTTVLFRKENLGWVQPNMFWVGDHESDWNGDVAMWVNLLGQGDAIYLSSVLSSFRTHGEQVSAAPDHLVRGLVDWAGIRRAALGLGFLRAGRATEVMGRALTTES